MQACKKSIIKYLAVQYPSQERSIIIYVIKSPKNSNVKSKIDKMFTNEFNLIIIFLEEVKVESIYFFPNRACLESKSMCNICNNNLILEVPS